MNHPTPPSRTTLAGFPIAARGIGLWLCCCLALSGCGGPPEAERPAPTDAPVVETPEHPQDPLPAAAPDDSWPLFRGDTSGSGFSAGSLPEQLELLWTFEPERASFQAAASIVDGTVYVGDATGRFYALDLESGEPRWQAEAQLGFIAPAAVSDNRVFVGDGNGVFHCFDAADGEQLWSHETGDEINSGPNLFEQTVLFGSQDGNLTRLNVSDGEVAWQFHIEAEGGIQCMPTLGNSRALFAGCDGQLHVIDIAAGESVAAVDVQDPTLSTPAIRGDVAYFGTEGGNFFAVNWRTAEVVWMFRAERGNQPIRSSAAVDGEVVVFGGRDRMVRALDPATGEELWVFPTRARVDSSPVIVGERVFVGSADGRLYAIDKRSGEEVWQYDAGGSFVAAPAVAGGRLVIGTSEGVLYCFGAPPTADN